MTSSARRALEGTSEGLAFGWRYRANGSINILNSGGESVDPCGTPVLHFVDAFVTSPAVVSIEGTRDDCIIATVFGCS